MDQEEKESLEVEETEIVREQMETEHSRESVDFGEEIGPGIIATQSPAA